MSSAAAPVAIVTGAGRGIGRAVALRLAAAGWQVAACARTAAQLDSLAAEAAAGTGRCLPLVADVTREDDVLRVVDAAERTLGPLDALVNNAGGGALGPLTETLTEQWLQAMHVNATGAFLFSREAARRMLPRGRGRIVNLSSIAAHRPAGGMAAYAASKYAVVGLTEVMARELRRHGIRVYSLCPGAVDTELRRAGVPDEDRSRIMQPQDVAALVAFLLAGEGSGLRELELEIF
ncbi:MAG: SDR family oxidoreductase [Burkholderiaceae bacterium]|nr:SDR family oxidoreductase [Burkholderiaceae bacterium]